MYALLFYAFRWTSRNVDGDELIRTNTAFLNINNRYLIAVNGHDMWRRSDECISLSIQNENESMLMESMQPTLYARSMPIAVFNEGRIFVTGIASYCSATEMFISDTDPLAPYGSTRHEFSIKGQWTLIRESMYLPNQYDLIVLSGEVFINSK